MSLTSGTALAAHWLILRCVQWNKLDDFWDRKCFWKNKTHTQNINGCVWWGVGGRVVTVYEDMYCIFPGSDLHWMRESNVSFLFGIHKKKKNEMTTQTSFSSECVCLCVCMCVCVCVCVRDTCVRAPSAGDPCRRLRFSSTVSFFAWSIHTRGWLSFVVNSNPLSPSLSLSLSLSLSPFAGQG